MKKLQVIKININYNESVKINKISFIIDYIIFYIFLFLLNVKHFLHY